MVWRWSMSRLSPWRRCFHHVPVQITFVSYQHGRLGSRTLFQQNLSFLICHLAQIELYSDRVNRNCCCWRWWLGWGGADSDDEAEGCKWTRGRNAGVPRGHHRQQSLPAANHRPLTARRRTQWTARWKGSVFVHSAIVSVVGIEGLALQRLWWFFGWTRSIWKMLGPFATASRLTPHYHSPGVASVASHAGRIAIAQAACDSSAWQ